MLLYANIVFIRTKTSIIYLRFHRIYIKRQTSFVFILLLTKGIPEHIKSMKKCIMPYGVKMFQTKDFDV